MIGYACDETPQLLPVPVVLANRIVRELSAGRRSGFIEGILSDGKAQVTVKYEDGRPVRLDSVVVSCQYTADKSLNKLEQEIRSKVLTQALRLLPLDDDTAIYINPSGRFVCGGMDADTGLTGRKLMVDTYGSMVPHGGGAFSGKDCWKVDRSGAYMARYIAKNMVAAGLVRRCQVSLAYAIGVAQPVMVQVDHPAIPEYSGNHWPLLSGGQIDRETVGLIPAYAGHPLVQEAVMKLEGYVAELQKERKHRNSPAR